MFSIDPINRRWIRSAEEKLKELFNHSSLYDIFNSMGDKPYITVLGPSQGGKSTLILRLMGLSGDNFKKGYDTIRGNRPEGARVTPCPTIYKISSDDYFRIRMEHRSDNKNKNYQDEPLKQDEAKNVLKKIYNDSFKITSKSLLHISIPREYVNITEKVEPIMIDLPGFDGHGDNPEVISEMYDEWVSKADCVFLVVYAEHMYKLNELTDIAGNDFPKVVKSWKGLPGRFKIVLTAYTKNQTEQDYWSKKKNKTVSDLNERLVGTLNDKNKGIHNCPSWLQNTEDAYSVFAFDYGKYWFQLEDQNNELAQQIKPLLDSHLDKLKDSIVLSTNELTRIRSKCDLYHALKELKNYSLEQAYSHYKVVQQQLDSSIAKSEILDHFITQIEFTKTTCLDHENRLRRCLDNRYYVPTNISLAKNNDERYREITELAEVIVDYYKQKINSTILPVINRLEVDSTVRQWTNFFINGLVQGIDVGDLYNQSTGRFLFVKYKNNDADQVILNRLYAKNRYYEGSLSSIVNRMLGCIDKVRTEALDEEKVLLSKKGKIMTEINRIKMEIEAIDKEVNTLNKEFDQALENASIMPKLLKTCFKEHKHALIEEVNKTNKQVNDNERKVDSICKILSLYKGAKLLNEIVGV